MIRFSVASTILISYISRCSQAAVWNPVLYLPAGHACCMMKGGGCSGPAELIFSPWETGANSRRYRCPGLPGFPLGKQPEGYRHGGEWGGAIYSAGKEKRWGNKRRGELKTRGWQSDICSRWEIWVVAEAAAAAAAGKTRKSRHAAAQLIDLLQRKFTQRLAGLNREGENAEKTVMLSREPENSQMFPKQLLSHPPL